MAGAGGALGLAGCLHGGEPEDEETDDTDEEGTGEDVPEETEFPIDSNEDFVLPTDPSDEAFVDRTGEAVVEVVTVERWDGDAQPDPQFVFDLPFVRVSQGTTVRWVNADGVFHSVTSTESLENRSQSGEFDEQINAEGDEFEWEADETGRQNYYCTPHAGFMYGAVEVV